MDKIKILKRTKTFATIIALFVSLSSAVTTFFLSFPMMQTNASNLKNQQFIIGQAWYRGFANDVNSINLLGIFCFILCILFLRLSYYLFYQE